MNWLAHVLLSKANTHYQLGNLLADPLKGRVWPDVPKAIEQGMKMHKAIDRFTDAHQLVSTSKARLGERGLLRGVIVDVVYDHFLAKHWLDFASVDLTLFLDRFYRDALQETTQYPEAAARWVERLVNAEVLSSYRRLEGVSVALQRMDHRLSARVKARATVSSYFSEVEKQYDGLEADFVGFFPDLIEFFVSHPLGDQHDHHLLFSANSSA